MKRFIPFLFLSINLMGCQHLRSKYTLHYGTTVETLADDRHRMKKVYVFALGDDSNLEKLFFERYTKAAFTKLGFEVVDDKDSADSVITVEYGIATENKLESRPTYSWIPGQTATVSGYSFNSYGGSTYSSGTVTTPGTVAKTGSEVYSYKEFTRYTIIACYPKEELDRAIKRKESFSETWKVSVVSSGRTNDLRHAFPYLLTAAMPYFGMNSDKNIKLNIYRPDEELVQIYKNLSSPSVRQPTARD